MILLISSFFSPVLVFVVYFALIVLFQGCFQLFLVPLIATVTFYILEFDDCDVFVKSEF